MSDVYERLFHLSRELLCTATLQGFFVELSPSWQETLGFTLDELRARSFLDFVHPDDREPTLAAVARLSSGANVIDFENRYQHKDGSYRRLRWRAQAPRTGAGYILAVARDVTAEAGASAQDVLASFQAVLGGVGDLAALLGLDGRPLYLNLAGRELLGLDPAGEEPPSLDQIFAPIDGMRLVERWLPVAVDAGAWEGEAELQLPGGATSAVALHLTALRNGSGAAVAGAAVARDRAAADRFEAEYQRRAAQQEALAATTSTPIIQVWDDIITMPVVGLVDSVRSADMKTTLLEVVGRTGARFAIIDLTGVDTVDTATADHLLKVMRAVQLLGARCVITGIQPAVAQIIVGLGLDLHGVITLRSLREGLRFCLRRLGFKIHREAPAAPAVAAEAQGTA